MDVAMGSTGRIIHETISISKHEDFLIFFSFFPHVLVFVVAGSLTFPAPLVPFLDGLHCRSFVTESRGGHKHRVQNEHHQRDMKYAGTTSR